LGAGFLKGAGDSFSISTTLSSTANWTDLFLPSDLLLSTDFIDESLAARLLAEELDPDTERLDPPSPRVFFMLLCKSPMLREPVLNRL
jgi:hypothetical protein